MCCTNTSDTEYCLCISFQEYLEGVEAGFRLRAWGKEHLCCLKAAGLLFPLQTCFHGHQKAGPQPIVEV